MSPSARWDEAGIFQGHGDRRRAGLAGDAPTSRLLRKGETVSTGTRCVDLGRHSASGGYFSFATPISYTVGSRRLLGVRPAPAPSRVGRPKTTGTTAPKKRDDRGVHVQHLAKTLPGGAASINVRDPGGMPSSVSLQVVVVSRQKSSSTAVATGGRTSEFFDHGRASTAKVCRGGRGALRLALVLRTNRAWTIAIVGPTTARKELAAAALRNGPLSTVSAGGAIDG